MKLNKNETLVISTGFLNYLAGIYMVQICTKNQIDYLFKELCKKEKIPYKNLVFIETIMPDFSNAQLKSLEYDYNVIYLNHINELKEIFE